jgi:hypothetical protein
MRMAISVSPTAAEDPVSRRRRPKPDEPAGIFAAVVPAVKHVTARIEALLNGPFLDRGGGISAERSRCRTIDHADKHRTVVIRIARTPDRTKEVEDHFANFHLSMAGDPNRCLVPFVNVLSNVRMRLERRRKRNPRPGIRTADRLDTARMVGVGMRKQDQVDLLHPQIAESVDDNL